MENGLNNHFKKISSELFIKYNSAERSKINKSIDSIIDRLEVYFEDEIEEVIVFGSYTRDTILPREFDEHSDIDVLIQFNTKDYDKLKPESYRNQLKKFLESYYANSIVAKDHPSVVVELNHIKFDLVPSIFDKGFFYESIEIPDKDGGWMETKPNRFNKKLTEANGKFNSIVKPIIRLLKYWNAFYNYPYSSYQLENIVVDMNFNNDNYESGFLYAVKNLSTSNLPVWAKNNVDSLKSNADNVRRYLKDGNIAKAKKYVERILPGFY